MKMMNCLKPVYADVTFPFVVNRAQGFLWLVQCVLHQSDQLAVSAVVCPMQIFACKCQTCWVRQSKHLFVTPRTCYRSLLCPNSANDLLNWATEMERRWDSIERMWGRPGTGPRTRTKAVGPSIGSGNRFKGISSRPRAPLLPFWLVNLSQFNSLTNTVCAIYSFEYALGCSF